jgi:SAM-dependent methyltransferase
MTDPKFPKLDPAAPEFWELRYRDNFTPWDAGGVPHLLMDYVRRATVPRNALVPGCGAAYEVRFLAEQGWNVLAIDFSAAAVEAAKSILGHFSDRIKQEDYFASALAPQSFDFIYERAFLCALPRKLWGNWAKRTADLLSPGGQLAGFFFFDNSERGPPFGLMMGELETLLAPNFTLVEEHMPEDSIPVFKGKEKWQVWVRA